MTPEATKTITTLEARVRQMLKLVEDLRVENKRINNDIQERDIEIELLKEELDECKRNYNTLKMARVIEISDGDKTQARQRLSALIREVDKCINIIKN